MEVYTIDEIEKIEDWIKKIDARNKVIEELHKDIQKLKDRTQETILEAKRYYDAISLEIF